MKKNGGKPKLMQLWTLTKSKGLTLTNGHRHMPTYKFYHNYNLRGSIPEEGRKMNLHYHALIPHPAYLNEICV